MSRTAGDGDLYRLVALIPPELAERLTKEMKRNRKTWLFKNRSRAVRALLEEALDRRDGMRRATRRATAAQPAGGSR